MLCTSTSMHQYTNAGNAPDHQYTCILKQLLFMRGTCNYCRRNDPLAPFTCINCIVFKVYLCFHVCVDLNAELFIVIVNKHIYIFHVKWKLISVEPMVRLYCIALHCIVLYCIALYCIVLYCIVLYCIVLYCIVLYCIVLYCIVFESPTACYKLSETSQMLELRTAYIM